MADDGNMDVVLATLVEEDRELLLTNQFRQSVGCGDIAGGERCQGRRIDLVDLARSGDLLAVLVDKKDDLRTGVDAKTVEELGNPIELLLIHHQTGSHFHTLLVRSYLTQTSKPSKDGTHTVYVRKRESQTFRRDCRRLSQGQLVHRREFPTHRDPRCRPADFDLRLSSRRAM